MSRICLALYRVFIYILSFEPHDNPEKQRHKHSVVSLSHAGLHPETPSDSPSRMGKPRPLNWSPFLLRPNTRPRTEERRPQNRLLPRPLSSWDPIARRPVGYPSVATLPTPPSSRGLRLRTGDSAPPQRGRGGSKGGAWNRGCVGGGCASRGAWAEGGRRHVETRGQRLAAQAPK